MNERQTLIDILTQPAGYGVQIAGYLDIRVLESGQIAVCEFFDRGGFEESIFDDIEKAVNKFLEIRERRKLGLDYDKESWKEGGLAK